MCHVPSCTPTHTSLSLQADTHVHTLAPPPFPLGRCVCLSRARRPTPLVFALVRGCNQLTDPSIIAIADNCKGLKELNVEYASPQLRPPLPAFRISRASDPLVRSKEVFKQFTGLQGVVPKEFVNKTAHDDANAKVGKSRTCNSKSAA